MEVFNRQVSQQSSIEAGHQTPIINSLEAHIKSTLDKFPKHTSMRSHSRILVLQELQGQGWPQAVTKILR